MWNKYQLIILLIFISACKVSDITTKRFNTKEDLCRYRANMAGRKIEENYIYRYKGNVSFQSKNYNLEGNIITLGDSVFYMNAVSKSFGIEVARIKVTKSKFTFINKMQKEYLFEDMDTLNKILPFLVDNNMISTLLLGTYFKQQVDYNCDNILEQNDENGKYYIFSLPVITLTDSITYKWKENIFAQLCWLNIYNSKNKLFTLSVNYQNFDSKYEVPLNSEGKLLMKGLNINYSFNIERINKYNEESVVVNIPEKYKQIKLNKLEAR